VVLTTRLDNKATENILNLATAITIAHFHKGRKRLPDLKAIVPPPKWKMSIVAFIGAYCISLLASGCDWT
jgi:hypothetical protein